jgi:hypothetical protein
VETANNGKFSSCMDRHRNAKFESKAILTLERRHDGAAERQPILG